MGRCHINNELTCCVTGNRPQKLSFGFNEAHPDCIDLKHKLAIELEKAIQTGYIHIIIGMALGTDIWAGESLLVLKKSYPQIIIEAAIPCNNQTLKWKMADKTRYTNLLMQCDLKTVLQKSYSHNCMMRRNEYMVKKSGLVIAVWNGGSGGTQQTLEYSERLGKSIVVIPVK